MKNNENMARSLRAGARRIGSSLIAGICSAFLMLDAFAEASSNAKERIELQCGSHRVAITCGKAKPGDPPDERVCVRNTLSFTGPDGKTSVIHIPKKYESEAGTPWGIECAQGRNGANYVVVAYTFCELSVCQLHDVYTEDGQHLTPKKQRADLEFDRVSGKLGLITSSKMITIEEYRK